MQSAILIGTEQTITSLSRQLALSPHGFRIVGCLTVEATNQPTISRVPVWGSIKDLALAHSAIGFQTAIISLPSALESTCLSIRARLRELGISERFVTPLDEMLSRPPAVSPGSGMPDVTELIGRVPYGIDRRSVGRILAGKRVLVTGAGGSIGSELSRIAATFRPELLILMERSENALFEIDRRVASRFPEVPRRALLHDVTDAPHTLSHLLELRPHTVFHAAAHKHVPLMEDHPAHAITNNFFGTRSIADAARACGAERFVLISSDKAVNPSSVMGATKRLAEMYVQSLANDASDEGRTCFSMVRFGNVLGSACSVLPIWSAQLAEGGPITVTDERMTRYFMTIHEAAMLVIQAAAIEPADRSSAAVYVLDMGEPIRILDLARRFVLAYGRQPTDAITFSGIRPGEKLHEELAYAAESLLPTEHPGIRAWSGQLPASFDRELMIAELADIRPSTDRSKVLAVIRRHVPEMNGASSSSEPMDRNLEPKPIRDPSKSQVIPTVKAA